MYHGISGAKGRRFAERNLRSTICNKEIVLYLAADARAPSDAWVIEKGCKFGESSGECLLDVFDLYDSC